ncbi:hypothetical protein [Oceaniserpentilla sp. 4NH20-0058]|uniref:hypothetical protein n=1 Tax=Oceaniserpentilla sp. 4NH20-0058 TaxID=3127660 RepID=UPI003340AF8F
MNSKAIYQGGVIGLNRDDLLINGVGYIVACLFLIVAFLLGFPIQFLTIAFMTLTYLVFRPKQFFHPNNVVFGFYFLYVVLPSTIDYFLNDNALWGGVGSQTHGHYLLTFSLYFLFIGSITWFLKKAFPISARNVGECDQYFKKRFKYETTFLLVLLLFLYSLIYVYLYKTGGLSSWIYDYKKVYLLGRKDVGHISLLLSVYSNFVVFVLGLVFVSKKRGVSRLVFFLIIFIWVMIPVAFLFGLKSRLIVLLIIFFIPFLLKIELSFRKGLWLFVTFIALFFIGNYIRSDGYYSDFSMFVGYLPSYFNSYILHDMLIKDFSPDYFTTIQWTFKKILDFLDIDNGFEFAAMSNWLTSVYFPKQWYDFSATQQWPIESEIYLNYGGTVLMVAPIFIYSFYISVVYFLACERKYIPLLFLYTYEFFRFFGSFRGSMLEWQLWVYLPMYLFLALMLLFVLKRRCI